MLDATLGQGTPFRYMAYTTQCQYGQFSYMYVPTLCQVFPYPGYIIRVWLPDADY